MTFVVGYAPTDTHSLRKNNAFWTALERVVKEVPEHEQLFVLMGPPEVLLRQAPYNTPQDVASNSRSLVQVAEQAHPLVQRCPSPNPMREHRNHRTHEEVVVGGGATPHG